jgi:hypothetical protein
MVLSEELTSAVKYDEEAKLRGVRDAESQMCRYLSHAIEQLDVSESSQNA